jgi:molybdopterin-guanine dinucleotide biosynthesis protein A
MRVMGAIVAGGQSLRMGREKAVAEVAGESLLQRTIAAVTPQVELLVLNANGDPARFAATGLAVLPDVRVAVRTPLAGIHAGLARAQRLGFERLLTVPSDCPFLPADLVQRLALAGGEAAIAASGGQSHFLTGLWSTALLAPLETGLDQGLFRVQDWALHAGAEAVHWPVHPFDPFFNVNSPEDLAEANDIAARFPAA